MIVTSQARALRRGLIGGVVLATLGASTPVLAYSAKVESQCRDDYFKYCPAYPVGSASLKLCMESRSKQLSRSCVKALIDAGHVDRRRIQRGF